VDTRLSPAESHEYVAVPIGVRLLPLTTFADARGDFTEIFRQQWHEAPPPVQWNMSRSGSSVLRGVHVHALHWDYLCVVTGDMTVGLHDLRPEATGACRSATLRLSGDALRLLVIPPGVAHGFYSETESMYVLGASAYYNPSDHRRCRWDSPELELDWPCSTPRLSPADRDAPSYVELKAAFLAAVTTRSRA